MNLFSSVGLKQIRYLVEYKQLVLMPHSIHLELWRSYPKRSATRAVVGFQPVPILHVLVPIASFLGSCSETYDKCCLISRQLNNHAPQLVISPVEIV